MTNLVRLRRLAAVLGTATWAAMGVVVLAAAWVLWQTPPAPANAAALFPDHSVAQGVTAWQLWLALALSGGLLLVLLWTLDQMRRLFGVFARGEVLSLAAATRILSIGRGLVALAGLTILVGAAQSALLSMAAPPGQRLLAIGISQSEVGFLLAGGLMTLIGWAMAEAAAVAEENRGFV